MSYMSQRSVIEKLDPNIRFRLSTFSPQFRDVERLVPLKIRELIMQSYLLAINGVIYRRKYSREAWVFEILEHFITFLNNRNEPIFADTLEIPHSAAKTLDDSTKFKTRNLLMDWVPFDYHQNLPLDPSCLPLKSVTVIWTSFPMRCSIFEQSTTLIIRSLGIGWNWKDLEYLPQRNVHFRCIPTRAVQNCRIALINRRLQKKFSFQIEKLETKMVFENYFKKFTVARGTTERTNSETRNSIYPARVIFPFDDELEIHYYYEKTDGYKNEQLQSQGLGWNFVMEMLPKGTLVE